MIAIHGPQLGCNLNQGQLGVGRNEDTATPKVVEIHNVVSVAAGEDGEHVVESCSTDCWVCEWFTNPLPPTYILYH